MSHYSINVLRNAYTNVDTACYMVYHKNVSFQLLEDQFIIWKRTAYKAGLDDQVSVT